MLFKTIIALAAVATTAWSAAVPQEPQFKIWPKQYLDMVDDFDGDGSSGGDTAPAPPPIKYHGGDLMLGPIHLNFILYGRHSPQVAENFKAFAQNLGYSDWWGVERTYYQPVNGTNVKISGRVGFHHIWHDDYSLGKDISADSAIPTIITNAIKKNGAEEDTNAIYTLYMAPDVTDGGFCDGGYCGYHTAFESPLTGNILYYSLIGDPTVCPGTLPPPGGNKGTPGCLPRPWRNTTDSINHNQHADGPMSAIAHEIAETASDKFGNAWFDRQGEENADKCNGNYLDLQHDPLSGQAYNLDLNGHKFLIQSNWDVITQSCSMGRNQHERN